MNPRHAAALALVGWYLIAPQPVVTPGSRVQNWTILKTFPTRQECEAQRHRNKVLNAFRAASHRILTTLASPAIA
jgi:hypothetical protein